MLKNEHFFSWMDHKKEENFIYIILISATIHAFVLFLVYYVEAKVEIIADPGTSSPIHINFSKTLSKKNQQSKIFEKKEQKILTDTTTNSKSSFFSKTTPRSVPALKEKSQESWNSFLPNSNQNYLESLRQQSQMPTTIQGDAGDIPIEGPSLTPTNQARVLPRYAEKDMSLFQFTQEFRERFGAVWNSEDRIVSPASSLHPGEVVYYKIYINTNGSMEKFANISLATHPQKNYADIDKIFSSVISHVFPMSVPPKFAHKNITLTEVIAIQVVDRNSPVRYSF